MTYVSKLSKVVLIFFIAVMFGGCTATVPMMAEKYDLEAEKFLPAPGLGNIYVVRADKYTGSAIAFKIDLDGRNIGSIAPGTYHLFEVEPGNHVVAVATMENSDFEKINVTEGENYFLEIKPKWGMITARVSIEMIDTESGRKLVIDGSRAETLNFD